MSIPLSEILNALGENREHYFNAVAPPILQSSNFAYPDMQSFRAAITSEYGSHVYSRGNNPTVSILRQKLAALEHTEDALVVGSGSAAIAVAVMSQVRSGDHVVCVRAPYSWTKALLTSYLPGFGVTTTYVDGTDLDAIAAAIQPNTRVLFLESPNSLTFEIQDLKACSAIAQKHNLVSMIDNSNATPIFQNPADLGIDVVLHSVSKYLNGHSDVVAGAICSSEALIRQMFYNEYMTLGPAISPSDAALILRGLRTLELRVQRSYENALTFVEYLKRHSQIEEVLFPMDPDFPQYALAKSQMRGCAGLVTIRLRATRIEQMYRFVDALQCFVIAVSWGGHESLVLPIAALYGLENREDPKEPWTMIRCYIGLDDPDLLIQDFERGFAAMVT